MTQITIPEAAECRRIARQCYRMAVEFESLGYLDHAQKARELAREAAAAARGAKRPGSKK